MKLLSIQYADVQYVYSVYPLGVGSLTKSVQHVDPHNFVFEVI